MSKNKIVTYTPGDVEDKLNIAWYNVTECIRKIDSKYKIKGSSVPCQASDADGGVIPVDISPIVFKLREDFDSSKEIFAVVKGSIAFKEENQEGTLRSTGFETRLEIYRNAGSLEHVFGVLYHFDSEKIDHPVFHAQISGETKLGEYIQDEFHDFKDVGLKKSKIKDIIKNIRLPIAQLDFFSVIVQLCADHMINIEDPLVGHKEHFKKLKYYCNCFQSAESYLTKNINGGKDNVCLRAVHWYGP